MRSVVRLSALLILAISGFAGAARAQFIEDALRVSTPGYGVGARAVAMGGAYTGVASDFSAIYWNPAGLAQQQYGEFSFGLSYLGAKDKSTYLGLQKDYSSNATNLNSLGFVFPVPVRRGSLVFALGFQREAGFGSGVTFNAFNPLSSVIQSYAANGDFYPDDLSRNLAYQVYLADIDTLTGRFISPITNRVTQNGQVLESGGLNNWSAGGAIDIAKDISLGVSLTYVSGSYRYDRSYEESDPAGLHQTFPYDFKRLKIDEYIDNEISGVNAKFGLMYRSDFFRLGIGIKTPTTFAIRETFETSAQAFFDNGDVRPKGDPYTDNGSSEYDIKSPWVLSGGLSVILKELVLSGDVEYTDWKQMEFANANKDVLARNKDFKTIFRGTLNLRAGAEFTLPGAGVRLRGGFALLPSPYQGDPESFDHKILSGGLGIPLGPSGMLDVTYARGWYDTFRQNYDASTLINETITTNTILATLTIRY